MDEFGKSESLWRDYSETKSEDLKENLIIKYAPLVKYVAGRLSVHINHKVEYDDLISYGIFGLIDAIEKFDYKKGVKFETYASLRIRGSIIDNLRKLDWVPRTLRQKNKQLLQASSNLESELGREPTVLELSEKLNLSLDETKKFIKKNSVISVISLDDYLEQSHENLLVESNSIDSPETYYTRKEMQEILENAIEKLPEKEKKVITLYYFEDLTLKEISKIIGVSESRISQLHSKAVSTLKLKLKKFRSAL